MAGLVVAAAAGAGGCRSGRRRPSTPAPLRGHHRRSAASTLPASRSSHRRHPADGTSPSPARSPTAPRTTWTDLQAYLFTSDEPDHHRARSSRRGRHRPRRPRSGSGSPPRACSTRSATSQPGETTAYRVSVPRRDLGITGEPGVYWIGVHVLGAGSTARAATRRRRPGPHVHPAHVRRTRHAAPEHSARPGRARSRQQVAPRRRRPAARRGRLAALAVAHRRPARPAARPQRPRDPRRSPGWSTRRSSTRSALGGPRTTPSSSPRPSRTGPEGAAAPADAVGPRPRPSGWRRRPPDEPGDVGPAAEPSAEAVAPRGPGSRSSAARRRPHRADACPTATSTSPRSLSSRRRAGLYRAGRRAQRRGRWTARRRRRRPSSTRSTRLPPRRGAAPHRPGHRRAARPTRPPPARASRSVAAARRRPGAGRAHRQRRRRPAARGPNARYAALAVRQRLPQRGGAARALRPTRDRRSWSPPRRYWNPGAPGDRARLLRAASTSPGCGMVDLPDGRRLAGGDRRSTDQPARRSTPRGQRGAEVPLANLLAHPGSSTADRDDVRPGCSPPTTPSTTSSARTAMLGRRRASARGTRAGARPDAAAPPTTSGSQMQRGARRRAVVRDDVQRGGADRGDAGQRPRPDGRRRHRAPRPGSSGLTICGQRRGHARARAAHPVRLRASSDDIGVHAVTLVATERRRQPDRAASTSSASAPARSAP